MEVADSCEASVDIPIRPTVARVSSDGLFVVKC
jgi:hypothetical protein